jgi:hypothetical protein
MLQACLVLWCLSGPVDRDQIRIVTTQDVYHNAGVSNRVVAVEGQWLIGGYVHQPDSEDAIFAGVLPLRINLLGERVLFDGGAILASSDVPRRGTHANWIARVQVQLTQLLAFEVVHVSNGGIRNIANPAVDSVGLSVRVR